MQIGRALIYLRLVTHFRFVNCGSGLTNRHETALELVSGANFGCVLHHFSSPTRWNGSRGQVRPETGEKPTSKRGGCCPPGRTPCGIEADTPALGAGADSLEAPDDVCHPTAQNPKRFFDLSVNYSMLRDSASGLEIGLPGRILAGLLPGKYRNRPSGRRSNFEKNGPEG